MIKLRIKNNKEEIMTFKDWNEAQEYVWSNLVDILED